MHEFSEKLKGLSVQDVLLEFRKALISLYPSLVVLDILEDDTQLYDDFDKIAEILWDVMVIGSLAWQDGLKEKPKLPTYGFAEIGDAEQYIFVDSALATGRFIQFVGDRYLGEELFNAVEIAVDGDDFHRVKLDKTIQFCIRNVV